MRRFKRADVLSLAIGAVATLGILAQIVALLVTGDTYCINDGCKVVESLTRISPVAFNTIGALFLGVITFLIFLRAKRGEPSGGYLDTAIRVLLLSGLSAEGVFISYQLFVAGRFCPYCLTVFSALFLLNLLNGWRQFVLGGAVVVAGILASTLLRYDPGVFLTKKNLDKGTYAIRTCTEPSRTLYLIFSKDCSHCKKVLEVLKGCSQCEFHFNPIQRITETILPGAVPEPSYDPTINVAILKILGINEIPVLMDKGEHGMLFIKGDREIIKYIEKHCFRPYPTLEEGLELEFQGGDGVCSLDKECGE